MVSELVDNNRELVVVGWGGVGWCGRRRKRRSRILIVLKGTSRRRRIVEEEGYRYDWGETRLLTEEKERERGGVSAKR